MISKILAHLLGSAEGGSPRHRPRAASIEQAQAEFEAAECELREVQRKAETAGRGMVTSEEVAATQHLHAAQHRLVQARAASAPGIVTGLLNLTEVEEIVEVGIDGEERLYVKPASRDFFHIFRAGMGVGWSPEGKFLYSPKPREWSYLKQYGQILGAARDEYRISLVITENTMWVGIGDDLKNEIIQYVAANG